MMKKPDGMEVRNALRQLNPATATVRWQSTECELAGVYFDGGSPVYRYAGDGREVHYNQSTEVFRAINLQDGSTFTLEPQSVDDEVIQLTER